MTEAFSEGLLNALLRRVDWRFLLPQPSPEKSVCFGPGMLADAVAQVSALTLQPGARDASDCDLAVGVEPTPELLEEAWQRLRPGGSVCFEVQTNPLSARSISRMFERAGFEDVTAYRPWPSIEAPLFWFPERSPAIVRYLLLGQSMAPTMLARAKDTARRLTSFMSLPFTRTHMCVIGRKPGLARGGILDFARNRWESWGLAGSADHLTPLLVTAGTRRESKVVMLLFESPSPQPRIAIKLPRIAGSTSALEHEAFCLRSLRESARAPLEGLPNVLFETDIGGVRAVGLTAFHGVPVFSYLDSWSFRQTSLRVTHWLVALARRRAVRDINTVTGNLCSDFRERFGAVANPGDLRRAEAALARIGPLPVVCEQRDFSPWNVLATREGSLAVLDWESA